MEVQENNLTKLCSFYVSDWHFATMLLPYINKKINEQAKIATILEKNMEKNIITLVEKLNLKNKEKISSLEWNKTQKGKNVFSNIEKEEEIIIIINGEKEFIEQKNEKIEKYLQTHKIKQNIKIINCYEITKFEGSIQEILDEHDKILNTSGEKEITEIFTDYQKSNSLKQKAVI